MQDKKLFAIIVVVFAVLVSTPVVLAGPVFFVEPDGNHIDPPADPTRDLAFQAALTAPPDGRMPFTEFDFADFGHEYIPEPSPLFTGPTGREWIGGVRVRPNLLDVNGNDAADLNVNGNLLIETFPIAAHNQVEGIMGANGPALLSRTFAGPGMGDVHGAAIEFTFSEPVEAFGTWIMDDFPQANAFVLKVTELGGTTYTSPLMDAGAGATLNIAGFIGAVSDVGIIRAVVEQRTVDGIPSADDFFYLDHVQVGRRLPGETFCDDGIDNNNNGLVDCDDLDCFDSPHCVEICDDGIDNTGNGLVDCWDPHCWEDELCMNLDQEVCGNGIDNDGDGLIDCEDPDCFGPPHCPTETICDDGRDNDLDCLIDGADPDCSNEGQIIVYIKFEDTLLDGPVYGADGIYVEPTNHRNWAGTFENTVAWAVSKFDLSKFLPPGTTSADIAWAAYSAPQTDIRFSPAHGQPWAFDLVLQHFETTDNTTIVSADHHTFTPALTDYGIVIPAHLQALNGLARRTVDVTAAIKSDLDNGRAISSFRLGANPEGLLTSAANVTYLATADNSDPFFGDGPEETRNVPRIFIQLMGEGEYDCTDGIDNSGNGLIDCADGGCLNHPACWPRELCGDGVDNNFNGLVDCEDPECANNICCRSCNLPFADADGDGDVDHDDFAIFQRCYTGPEGEEIPTIEEYDCTCFDRDGDGAIDGGDFMAFQLCASGPTIPADPGCADLP